MAYYFVKDQSGRKGNRITIATALSNKYEAAYNKTIKTKKEYEEIVQLAQDRSKWKETVAHVVKAQYKAKTAKLAHKAELRKLAKAKRLLKGKGKKKKIKGKYICIWCSVS